MVPGLVMTVDPKVILRVGLVKLGLKTATAGADI